MQKKFPADLVHMPKFRSAFRPFIDGEKGLDERVDPSILDRLDEPAFQYIGINDLSVYRQPFVTAISQSDYLFPNNGPSMQVRWGRTEEMWIVNIQAREVVLELFKHFDPETYRELFNEYTAYSKRVLERDHFPKPLSRRRADVPIKLQESGGDAIFELLFSQMDREVHYNNSRLPGDLARWSRMLINDLAESGRLEKKGFDITKNKTYVAIHPNYVRT